MCVMMATEAMEFLIASFMSALTTLTHVPSGICIGAKCKVAMSRYV